MKVLGYKLTWPTKCFLGCEALVWAHTNGDGDFVLFDALGHPWPKHPCYENRASTGGHLELDRMTDQELAELLDVLDSIETSEFSSYPRPIVSVDPAESVRKGAFITRGKVHFYRENRLMHFMKQTAGGDIAETQRVFGKRTSELGIVDKRGNLFSLFVDLHNTVISPGAVVEVQIGACRVAIKKLGAVFLCHGLRIIPPPERKHSLPLQT